MEIEGLVYLQDCWSCWLQQMDELSEHAACTETVNKSNAAQCLCSHTHKGWLVSSQEYNSLRNDDNFHIPGCTICIQSKKDDPNTAARGMPIAISILTQFTPDLIVITQLERTQLAILLGWLPNMQHPPIVLSIFPSQIQRDWAHQASDLRSQAKVAAVQPYDSDAVPHYWL